MMEAVPRRWRWFENTIDRLLCMVTPAVRFGRLTEDPPRSSAPRAAAGAGCPPLEPHPSATAGLEGGSPTTSGACFCAYGCDSGPMADPGVFPPCNCWCHDRPPGAGLRANDCQIDTPGHVCVNREGDPVRVGQSCWHTARNQSLRTLAERHPRWAQLLHDPVPAELTDAAKAAYDRGNP